jgi:hypothetical protein
MRDKHRELLEKGKCPHHPQNDLEHGLRRCRVCSDNKRRHLAKAHSEGRCAQHADMIRTKNQVCVKCTANSMSANYGLSMEAYTAMYRRQSGRCAGCDKSGAHITAAVRRGEKLYVDHCHQTQRVRWLLCCHCNTMLGSIEGKADVLLKLLRLLQDWHAAGSSCPAY